MHDVAVRTGETTAAVQSKTNREFDLVTAKSTDSLSEIAEKRYGNAYLWPIIFNANRDTVLEPALIAEGQTIKVPRLEKKPDGVSYPKSIIDEATSLFHEVASTYNK